MDSNPLVLAPSLCSDGRTRWPELLPDQTRGIRYKAGRQVYDCTAIADSLQGSITVRYMDGVRCAGQRPTSMFLWCSVSRQKSVLLDGTQSSGAPRFLRRLMYSGCSCLKLGSCFFTGTRVHASSGFKGSTT